MNPAAPSREAMHGLILPPPVSFWPGTTAWYVLFAMIGLLALLLCWRCWRHWRRNAYRRQALREWRAAEAPAEVAALLKRTALAAWPRADVAALAGSDWAAFLRRTAPRARLDAAMAEGIARMAYATPPDGARDAAARWIRFHDPRA
ncbi:DUF4381 domain-containing protein [Roseomonas terrae]|uniref:DUF4381 domain-containing protein n=1 Tax=Neoroseomonas terrae TaxID=424799 RepID=A0ABS5EF27_9PROT|nr:DUF4381 domain-containing protein [Neoroseomonas terrae]MBR0649624.1 DUF4381 domain-containing protein [Neoroseomonas terrae]